MLILRKALIFLSKSFVFGLMLPYMVVISIEFFAFVILSYHNSSNYIHFGGLLPISYTVQTCMFYYGFCLLFFLIRNQRIRKVLVALFLILPGATFPMMYKSDWYEVLVIAIYGLLFYTHFAVFHTLFREYIDKKPSPQSDVIPALSN